MRRRAPWAVGLALLAGPVAAQSDRDVRQALLVAEDGRGRSDAERRPLVQALTSRDPALLIEAAWGLGRFERAGLALPLETLLKDSRADVRAAAAHGLGQLGQDSSGTAAIAVALRQAMAAEADPVVVGALARSLGRLPFARADEAAPARAALLAVAARPGPVGLLLDATRALEQFGRKGGRLLPPDPAVTTRLRTLAQLTSTSPEAARTAIAVRRAALVALDRGGADRGTAAAALADQEPEVRRIGVLFLADSIPIDGRSDLLLTALADRSPMVRVEALRAWARHPEPRTCPLVVKATADPSITVALEAIDQLAKGGCDPDPVSRTLGPLVDTLTAAAKGDVGTIASWHRGAHALIALARIDPTRVRASLARAASHHVWQVRMYAARAAGIMGDGERLLVLAEDGNDNVREAAVDGLIRARGPAAVRSYLAQLGRDDHQLLITAARALAGTPERVKAFSGLLEALKRLTDQRRETSRDARLALLDRLADFDQPGRVDSLAPFVTDYDPAVATRAAAILSGWSGQTWRADPRPLPRPPISVAELDRLRGARIRFTMSPASGGGTFELELYPTLAPVTVLRVTRLAESGYYDGLSFHRIVPNFVIQGGSPKANEYTGDGPYLRDEVGPLSHERGTVGISTRGRDTGDAQIFVNLVENLRLDFDYTVFAAVVSGMEIVDAMLEGDVIERADVVRR